MRRSGIVIMVKLASLLGSLTFVMLLAVINGALGFVCAIGVPVFGAIGVAKLLGENIALSYELIAALAVLCGLLRGFLRYLEQYGNHYIAFKLLAVLRDKIFRALRVLSPAKLETKRKGGLIAMMTSDIETLEVFYAHTLSPVCIAVLVSAGIFIFVGFLADWRLALAGLAGHTAVGLLLPVIGGRALKKPGIAYRSELASFNSYFLDSIKGIGEIRLYGAGGRRLAEVNRRSGELLRESRGINTRTFLFSSLTQAVVSLLITAALAAVVFLLPGASLSPGLFIVGLTAIFSSFGPVIALSALPGSLTQTFAAGDRILNLLDEKPEAALIADGADFDFRRLEVKNLTFGYGEGRFPVLRGVNFEIKRGEIVGISGASGSGKSTVLKLLLRFFRKGGGEILYNGTDIERINTRSLLENVSMVSQTTYLFDDTIEENLRFVRPDASFEEIENACLDASIHDFIAALPDGYNTRVGALGGRLSAGERQRIGLARAFLRGSPLILLDEPTSNIDSINEGIILAAVKKQRKNKAFILVSHRDSTMAIADRVYRMKPNGELS